jgi:CubicO group peptidase (beta-lactamase class C family)
MKNAKKITRRAVLSGLGLSVASGALAPQLQAAPQQPPPGGRDPFADIPITGQAGPGLAPIDTAMRTIIDRHGLAGAALAITKDGRLVLAKGYGWADLSRSEHVQPETLFGLASLTKSITATATLKLVEQGVLRLDDRVFDIVNVQPPAGARIDQRVRTITVRHCLNHSGGWDRMAQGDPIGWELQVCRAMRVRPPLSPRQFVTFAITMPLEFDPGTAQKYSNVGYIILGEVIATVAKQDYHRFVTEQVLRPMGITRAALHRQDGKYLPGEAVRYLPGTLIPLPAMLLPMVDATGGWSASVVDMARFLTNLEGTRGQPVLSEKTRRLMIEPPPPPLKVPASGVFTGLGWDNVMVKDKTYTIFKDGSYQGMRTFMKRLPTGVCWCLFYNCSMEFDPIDTQIASAAIHDVRRVVEEIDRHPDVDLFKEFR